ncbi:MAG: hypothetical protein F7O42_14270, partial [Opitutae bacterium]|nr:hypothetical protein [Opitutae bacterium]
MLRNRTKAKKRIAKKHRGLPSATDWRTTDKQELLKRRIRAKEEMFRISNCFPQHPVFSNFSVKSGSGLTYSVEIRDLQNREFDCTCTDFRINGLGSCKHVEAVLLQLKKRQKATFNQALLEPSSHIDIVPDDNANLLWVERNLAKVPPSLRVYFDADGLQNKGVDSNELVGRLKRSRSRYIRLSQTVEPWLRHQEIDRERKASRRDYETGIITG